ncbi:MAG: hypothetical protein KAJ35_08115, partial [Thermoplasmata archaeon]|nr:hypothetical protein [Thermoplasmata archaeon]
MKHRGTYLKLTSVAVALIMITVTFQPSVLATFNGLPDMGSDERNRDEIPGPFRNLKQLVIDLIDATPNPEKTLDADGDGLPDNVEWTIGTDFTRPDTDFDKINDYTEVMNNMDPTEPDSNFDGMPDFYEFNDVDLDVDGDGVPNAWDFDNDGDGVYDEMDISPYVNSDVRSSFDFDLTTSGNPLSLVVQVRTSNPENMRLYDQHWDWPEDSEGTMRDIDGSTSDVKVVPMLEFTTDTLPGDKEILEEYGINIQGNTMYVPVFPVWEFGNIVAFKGKMFWPETGVPTQIEGDLKLSWKVKGLTDSTSMALGYFSGGNKYTYVAQNDNAIADSPVLGEPETFYWVEVSKDYGGFQTMDGRTLTVNDRDFLVAQEEPLDDRGYFEVEEVSSKKVLRAYNGKYLRVQGDDTIVADAASSTTADLLNVLNEGVKAKSTTLAYYFEDFAVTGVMAEEHFGTDAAVLYSENMTHTFAANLRLAYQYLRNGTTTVDDIIQLLEDYDVTMDSNISKFSHRDLAAQALMQEMVKEARDKIPEDVMRPIITILESRSKTVTLADV